MDASKEILIKWLDGLLRGEFISGELPPGEDPELQAIGERLRRISGQMAELKEYALALARGNLEVDFPSRSNYLAGGLKELHANMLHLVWKVGQIAQGNYSQQVDFMGQLAEAFNQMATMLDKRNLQLTQGQSILEIILSFADISLFVLEKESGGFLHGRENLSNYSKQEDLPADTARLVRLLQEKTGGGAELSSEWKLFCPENNKWYLVNSMPGAWANDKEAYFHVLTNISENIELSERLQQAMYRDTKFDAYNQAYALLYLGRLIESRATFAACYFDLDNFKQVNDQMGHDAGDQLIISFIAIAGSVIRARDVFCRMGGDEFMLILSDITEQGARRLVERLAEKTAQFNASQPHSPVLAFSYGIVAVGEADYSSGGLTPCTAQGCREKYCGLPLCVINRADRRMYEHKREKK